METLFKLFFPTGSFTLPSIVFSLMFTYIAVKAIYEAYKWIKARFDGYHEEKNTEENKEEKIEERLQILEKHDKGQYLKLNELSDQMKEVISMIKKVQDTQSNAIIETHRSTIFRIYHDVMKQGCITQTELDRFIALVNQYKAAGGDGIVDEKVYPEVLALPIKETTNN